MKIITPYFLCALFVVSQFFPANFTLANGWGLEKRPLELDMCDSVILHYDGKAWSPVYHKFNTWLDDICGFGDDNIYAAGGRRTSDAAYIAFRGRLPSVDALLARRGLVDAVPAGEA